MPAITVIVTAYNIEDYIDQCLDSVAAQSLTDLEVLVVDDGSTDSTPERITWYAERDERFVPVLLEQNSPGGVATAANAGLNRASAPWVGFVDGDDFVEPQMFERLVSAAREHECDLAMCQYDEVEDGTGETREPADARRWQDLTEHFYRLDKPDVRRTFLRFIAVPWRKIYRRSLLEGSDIRFPEGDYFFEDNPFHWFSVLSAGSVAVVPEVLCHHRVARAGQTMASADERLLRIFAHHDTIQTFLRERDLADTYGRTLLGWAISQLEWISRRTPPDLYRALYERLVPILAQYDTASVSAALVEGRKGEYAQRLTMAIAKGQYPVYRRLLEGKPDPSNPVVVGLHHLRTAGARDTAAVTARYLRQRVPAVAARRVGPRQERETVTNNDLIFGLMAVQDQLARIERRLDDLESRGNEK